MSATTQKGYNLRPLWDAILEVYGEFDRVCNKYGIEYTAIGGTAIGAVRHNGFIPWDDDMDLGIKVEDFERFRTVAVQELPPYFKLVTWDNTKGYPNLFAKIADTRLDRLEEIRRESGLSIGQGVFIDLFLISGIPNSFLGRAKRNLSTLRVNAIRNFAVNGFRGGNPIVFIKRLLGWMLSGFRHSAMTANDYVAYLWQIGVNCPTQSCNYSGSYYGQSNRMYHFKVPTRCFDKTIRVAFENTTLPLCVGFDEVVRAEYPDYLTLPPPEKQVLLHSDQIDAPWLAQKGHI